MHNQPRIAERPDNFAKHRIELERTQGCIRPHPIQESARCAAGPGSKLDNALSRIELSQPNDSTFKLTRTRDHRPDIRWAPQKTLQKRQTMLPRLRGEG
jgi:hypothetical protein